MKLVVASIREIPHKTWNAFVSDNGGCFLQSVAWADFQRSLSKDTFFLYVVRGEKDMFDASEVALASVAVRIMLPKGYSYLYLPRGPVFSGASAGEDAREAMRVLMSCVKDYFSAKTVFLRMEPPLDYSPSVARLMNELSFKRTIALQPQATGIIDLSRKEEDIFFSCKEKTRYNIRLAERKGVLVTKDDAAFEEFWPLMRQTARRNRFQVHPKQYYEALYRAGGDGDKDFSVHIYYAWHAGEILAVAMVAIFYRNAYYLHGASSGRKKNYMASHLLHWRIIQDIKRGGAVSYDLWGKNPSRETAGGEHKKSFEGITRFKEGFSGREKIYAGTFDYPFNVPLYRLYGMLRRVRRMI